MLACDGWGMEVGVRVDFEGQYGRRFDAEKRNKKGVEEWVLS